MPTGIPRVSPLPKCKRPKCKKRVKAYRQAYCSRACFGLATKGSAKPRKPQGTFQGPLNVHTVKVEEAPVVSSAESFWLTASRDGFTATAADHKFSTTRLTRLPMESLS